MPGLSQPGPQLAALQGLARQRQHQHDQDRNIALRGLRDAGRGADEFLRRVQQEAAMAQQNRQFSDRMEQSERQFEQSAGLERELADLRATLDRERMGQQGEQFGQTMDYRNRALAQSGDQFSQGLAQRRNEFGARLGFDERALAQSGDQFSQRLGLDERALTQRGDQFTQRLGLDLERMFQDDQQHGDRMGLGYATLGVRAREGSGKPAVNLNQDEIEKTREEIRLEQRKLQPVMTKDWDGNAVWTMPDEATQQAAEARIKQLQEYMKNLGGDPSAYELKDTSGSGARPATSEAIRRGLIR